MNYAKFFWPSTSEMAYMSPVSMKRFENSLLCGFPHGHILWHKTSFSDLEERFENFWQIEMKDCLETLDAFGNVNNNPHLDGRKIRKMWKVREIWVRWPLLPFYPGHIHCTLKRIQDCAGMCFNHWQNYLDHIVLWRIAYILLCVSNIIVLALGGPGGRFTQLE